MRLIARANQIRLFNTALGTQVTDFSGFPVDFVETVCAWQAWRETPENER